MTLKLSPEDEAEYQRLCRENEDVKQAAINALDDKGAKKARQYQSYLYTSFEKRQLPPDPPTKWELEEGVPLKDRILRIEEHLKLGRFADNF